VGGWGGYRDGKGWWVEAGWGNYRKVIVNSRPPDRGCVLCDWYRLEFTLVLGFKLSWIGSNGNFFSFS